MMIDGSTYGVANPLAPWTGLAVMCVPALLLTALAAWRLRATPEPLNCPADVAGREAERGIPVRDQH
ncbi:MAG: hypothetical protein ACR2KG_08620 [Nocardioidaceae bacterium]